MSIRKLSTAILDHAKAREVFKGTDAGFAVNVYTGFSDGQARYSQPNELFRTDALQGHPYMSSRAGFKPLYIVRVWPKHNDTRFRVPPPKEDTRTFDEAERDIKWAFAYVQPERKLGETIIHTGRLTRQAEPNIQRLPLALSPEQKQMVRNLKDAFKRSNDK